MGLRRPGVIKDYEEMPGANVPEPSMHTNHHMHPHHHRIHNTRIHNNHSSQLPQRNVNHTGDMTMCQDLEMSSVSVVPDGEFILVDLKLRCIANKFLFVQTHIQ